MRSNYLTVKNTPIHYREIGSGRPLLLVHGWGGEWAVSVDPTLPTLAEHFRVIILDLPGYGQSAALSCPHTVANYAAFLGDFLDTLGLDSVYLQGHSLGCNIILELAAGNPERIGRIILNAPVFKLKGVLGNGTARPIVKKFVKRLLFGNHLNNGISFLNDTIDPHKLPQPLLRFADQAQRYCQASKQTLWENADSVLDHNLADCYQQVAGRIPVKIIYGERDFLSEPRAAPADADCLIVPGAYHSVFLEAPETYLKEVLAFLND